ncbi:MAG: TRAP transporter permease, partial [Pseudomonadota bacterium]
MADAPENDSPLRRFDGSAGLILNVFCFLIAAGHIYVAFDPVLSELQRNGFHFAGFAILAALFYPLHARMPVAVDLAIG